MTRMAFVGISSVSSTQRTLRVSPDGGNSLGNGSDGCLGSDAIGPAESGSWAPALVAKGGNASGRIG